MPAFENRKSQLLRERELVQALMKRGMLPPPNQGSIQAGDRIVPDWGSAIDRLGAAFFGKQMNDELTKKEDQYSKDYNNELRRSAGEYLDLRNGRPDTQYQGMTGGLDEQDIPGKPAVAADPRRAVVEALVSEFPELKALAAADLASLNKVPKYGEVKVGKDLQGNRRFFQSRDDGGDPRFVTGIAPEDEFTSVNGQMVPKNTPGDYRNRFGPALEHPSGVLYQNNLDTGETRFGPSPRSTTTNVVGGAKAWETAEANQWASSMDERRKTLTENINVSLPLIFDLQNQIKTMDPRLFGPASPLVRDVGAFAAQLGWKVPDGVKNLTDVHAKLGELVLANIRKLAPVTKVDIDEMARIKGTISNPRDQLSQILDVAQRSIARDFEDYHKRVKANPRINPDVWNVPAPDGLFNYTSTPYGAGGVPQGGGRSGGTFDPATGKIKFNE